MLLRIIKTILFLCSLCVGFSNAFSQNTVPQQWHYDIQCENIGLDGTKLIKVWSYSKKEKFPLRQAQKNAIHGMIFKGFSGNATTGCPTQRPLADSPDLESKQAAFFAAFFADNGPYQKYVNSTIEETPIERIRVGKEYKIGIIITVMYSQLRKDLERQGIIKPLDAGF
ncbi:hypothetical protein F0919_10965 [Taibaiella lutea]|uniref:Uncharacterized protein n=1 Tax=Taibaiella lutea TaxID=2608001 RepID=A0A5M6CJ28_9BACT|nr:hypothetical protein [Taibaiella lutea]KAA5535104.1 hypothetical protein F0919_10965 [Taibaiella lutea]